MQNTKKPEMGESSQCLSGGESVDFFFNVSAQNVLNNFCDKKIEKLLLSFSQS